MRVSLFSPRFSPRLIAASVVGLAVFAASTSADAAETRVRARYDLTLAGFSIGTASMQAGIDGASYDMNVSARLTGLASFLTGVRGAATSRGALRDAVITPTAYAINTKSGEKGQVIRYALAGGAIRTLSVEPPPKVVSDMVPLTDADKRGIVDPVSALMMPVSGSGELLSSSSCDRTLPVFDGRQRFDVQLRYDRAETVKPAKGGEGQYEGKAIVCKATYKAIAGHRPGRKQVVFMESNKDMEIWLAPVAGTRALLPWKISVRTEIGTAVITATSFVVGGPAAKKGGADSTDL